MATYKEVIEGLQILAKYSEDDEHQIAAEHDELYAGPDDPSVVTEDDRGRLNELGWRFDPGLGCWRRFV